MIKYGILLSLNPAEFDVLNAAIDHFIMYSIFFDNLEYQVHAQKIKRMIKKNSYKGRVCKR